VLPTDLPTGLVTFMFTDIEGSTLLMRELGDAYGDVQVIEQILARAQHADRAGQPRRFARDPSGYQSDVGTSGADSGGMNMGVDLRAEGKWDQMKGRVKEAWGDLTDDDLDKSEGKMDRLVGTIKEKTGEAADKIEEKLGQLADAIGDKAKKN
jgi:uncharacterized protein YjbJ (UPF0337 family)